MNLRTHQINNWGFWELQEKDQGEKGVSHKDAYMC